MKKAFVAWLPLAAAITGVCILIYMTVQQNYRQSLNDPQIQMAEDAASALVGGDVPASVVPRGAMVDIAASLSPWIGVYDSSGKPLESSGVLDGKPPQPPQGVFDAARLNSGKDTLRPHENRVSWQPNSHVRQAIVVVAVPGIDSYVYVVAGRNMREVEERESQLHTVLVIGWLVILAATLATRLILGAMPRS